jgi:hypothetical protein
MAQSLETPSLGVKLILVSQFLDVIEVLFVSDSPLKFTFKGQECDFDLNRHQSPNEIRPEVVDDPAHFLIRLDFSMVLTAFPTKQVLRRRDV